MEWNQAESRQYPELVDATSCPGKVYVRTNVKEVTHDEETYYSYQEALMSKEGYQSYSGQMLSNISELVDENSQAILELAEIIGEMEG